MTKEESSIPRFDGSLQSVLLIHGFAGSPVDLEPLSRSLRNEGIAHESIVLPGHGTTPEDLRYARMQDWLTASFSAYDSLQRLYGKVSVVGFSMGGALALFLASGRDVHKLVLISPYFKVKGAWYYFGSPEAWARRINRLIPFVRKFKPGQINDPAGLRRYSAYSRLPMKPIAELAELGRIAATKAQQVRCETMWIHSRGDFVADFEFSRKTFDSVPVRGKHMVEYERSNHVILYDYDSDDAIRRILHFLRGG